MNADMEKVFNTIRKLLALSNNPNVNEAASAARKARALLIKHDLSVEQVMMGQEKIGIVNEWFTGERPMSYKTRIYNSVAKYCFCTVLMDTRDNFYVYGKEHHIKLFHMMKQYVVDCLDRDTKAAVKNGHHNASYRDGWSIGFMEKVQSMNDELTSEELALVVREDADLVDHINSMNIKSVSVKARPVYSASCNAGKVDGRNVNLNSQLK